MVRVTLTGEGWEKLSELPRLMAVRMEKLLTRLGQWPNVSGVKHLRGELVGRCRLRTGDYRLQFRVEEKKRQARETKILKGNEITLEKEVMDYIVTVEKIEHRDGFYE